MTCGNAADGDALGRQVSHRPGTLDTTSQLLLDLALIEEVEGTDAAADQESRRRYYRLTGTGKVLLETEIGHMDSIVRLARRRKLIPRAAA